MCHWWCHLDWFQLLFLFQHPFVSQPLSRTLAIELLDKSNNPDHSTFNDFDDDDPEPEVTFDLQDFLLNPKFCRAEHKCDCVLLDHASFLPQLPSVSSVVLSLNSFVIHSFFSPCLLPPFFVTCESSFCSVFPFLTHSFLSTSSFASLRFISHFLFLVHFCFSLLLFSTACIAPHFIFLSCLLFPIPDPLNPV